MNKPIGYKPKFRLFNIIEYSKVCNTVSCVYVLKILKWKFRKEYKRWR